MEQVGPDYRALKKKQRLQKKNVGQGNTAWFGSGVDYGQGNQSKGCYLNQSGTKAVEMERFGELPVVRFPPQMIYTQPSVVGHRLLGPRSNPGYR